MRRVVITGVGVVSPIGIGREKFWANLIAGQTGIRHIEAFDPGGLPCQIAGQVPPFKIIDYVPKSYRKSTKVMARDTELALIAADDAFRDAKLNSKAYTETADFDGTRFGCNIGAGLIGAELNELTAAMFTASDGPTLDLNRWGKDGMFQLTPLWLLKYLPNMLACHVTIVHQLKGPSNTITCADSSSHLAIGEAFRTIQRGKADLAICGGAESKIQPLGFFRQILLKRLTSTRNDTPQSACRPFDADADGTVMGEGGGLFILEELGRALERKAAIYAELVGFAATQDTYRITEPDPTGHSYSRAIINALADAKLAAAQVSMIVPHGLGIPTHDRAELTGFGKVFGDRLSRIPFAPIKAQTGCLAAGCGIDAAATVLAIKHNTVPPAVNTKRPHDGFALNVSPESRTAQIDIALSSTYSLGGQNAALVFKRWEP
jgi:3-oxoacyl-[acyl-carrier-protein] synthase II